jgi:hypothetical protein
MATEQEIDAATANREEPKLPWRRLSALILAGLTAIAVYLGRGELWPTLKEIDPLWLLIGLALHLVNYYFRALRLRQLTEGRLKIWPTGYRAICIHGVATYLMPLRTGELALPALLRSAYGASWAEGLRLLIWARVMDMCALGIWVLVAATFLEVAVSGAFMAFWVLCGAALAASPLLVYVLPLASAVLPAKLKKHLGHLEGRAKFTPGVLFSSLGVWTMTGSALYCTARAVALPLGMGDIWFIVTVQLPLQLAPIQGIANSGNHEAGWVAALTMLGLTASDALNFALATHAVHLLYIVTISLLLVLLQAGHTSTKQ